MSYTYNKYHMILKYYTNWDNSYIQYIHHYKCTVYYHYLMSTHLYSPNLHYTHSTVSYKYVIVYTYTFVRPCYEI